MYARLAGLWVSRKSPASTSRLGCGSAGITGACLFVQLVYGSGDLNSGPHTSPSPVGAHILIPAQTAVIQEGV